MHARFRLAAVAATASLLIIALTPTGAGAQVNAASATGRDPRTITVTGTGIVEGTPDVLELSIGVDTRARSASQALTRNNTQAGKVIQVLRDAGVESKDIQTNNLSLSPVYNNDGTAIIAYSVSNQVTAKFHDILKVGAAIDAAAGIAGDEIVVNGITFSFDDNTKIVAQARTKAVQQARAQATQLAKAAGVELLNILSISEDSAPQGPVQSYALGKGSADSAAPIEPGSQSLSVTVTLTYEIR